MRSNTAKIFFVVCVLLQGTNSIRAAQALPNKFAKDAKPFLNKEKKPESPSQIKSNWLFKTTDEKEIPLKLSDRKIEKTTFKSNKYILANHLSPLKAPQNLLITEKSSDISNRELYPLKIADIEKLVEFNNPKLEISRRKIQQQKYNLRKAIAAWYPTLDLGASPQYLDGEDFPDSGINTSSEQWKTTLSMEINWNLIDPTRIAEIAAAKDTFKKAKTSYLIELKDLQLEALNAYFLLQKSDEGVRIGKESMLASQISLRDAKARFQSGLGTRIEVLEAETQLARDKRLLTQKLSDQNINRSSLSTILNLPPQFIPLAASPTQIIGVWNASLEESIISAYSIREELANIKRDISINNSNANASLAIAQPKLSIFNTFSNSYTNGKLASINKDGSSTSNTVGLKATWRIFDGGSAKAGYNYNKQIAKASESEFVIQRNNIRQEIEKDFFKLRNSTQDIASSTREVIAAKESLRLARLRFKAGVSTQREVVNNQRDLTQAEVGYSEAITAYNTSISNLRRRTGIDHMKTCSLPKIIPNDDREINSDALLIEPFPAIKPCKKSSMRSQG